MSPYWFKCRTDDESVRLRHLSKNHHRIDVRNKKTNVKKTHNSNVYKWKHIYKNKQQTFSASSLAALKLQTTAQFHCIAHINHCQGSFHFQCDLFFHEILLVFNISKYSCNISQNNNGRYGFVIEKKIHPHLFLHCKLIVIAVHRYFE